MQLTPPNADKLILKLSSAPLVIYGMGYVGNMIAEWCGQNGLSYIFCDQNAVQKRTETGQTVILPEQLAAAHPKSYIVAASINYQNEIRAELADMDIDPSRILSYLDFWPERADWDELEASVDWGNVRKRAEIFAAWIKPFAESVADYSCERNFLKEFLRENVRYESPDYIRFRGNTPYVDFSGMASAFQTDVSSCLAMLMSFCDPAVVIDYLCAHTRKAIIASYVPLERLPDIPARRSINYNNDYTERQLINAFGAKGFQLIKAEQDPFDAVHIVYLFEKQESGKESLL